MANVGDLKIKEDGHLYRIAAINDGVAEIDDLGEATPVSVDGKDRVVQFEMDGKAYQVGSWGPDGAIRDYTERKKFKPEPLPPEPEDANVVTGFGKGVAKGAGQTVTMIAKGLNAIPGVGETLSPKTGVGVLERMSEPKTGAQEAGAIAESVGEMFVTGGPLRTGVSKAVLGAAKLAPKVAQFPKLVAMAPKVVAAGSEAVNAAGNAAIHGEDPAVAAAFGAGGQVVADLAPMLVPPLKKSAGDQYNRLLAATTKRNKATSERIVPELIERGEVGSMAGLTNKAEKQVAALGGQIDDAVKAVPEADRVDATSVINALEDYKKEFIVDGVQVAPQAVAHINELQKTIDDIVSSAEGNQRAFGGVPYQSLNKVRQIWDGVVAKADGYGAGNLAEGSMVDAMREGANAIRAELSKAQPDIAKINQEFRLWKGLNDVLEDTALRRTGQSGGLPKLFTPGAGVMTTSGAFMGGVPLAESVLYGSALTTALSLVDAAVKSGHYNTLSAVAKDKLAKAIMDGNAEAVEHIFSRSGAAISSQTEPSDLLLEPPKR